MFGSTAAPFRRHRSFVLVAGAVMPLRWYLCIKYHNLGMVAYVIFQPLVVVKLTCRTRSATVAAVERAGHMVTERYIEGDTGGSKLPGSATVQMGMNGSTTSRFLMECKTPREATGRLWRRTDKPSASLDQLCARQKNTFVGITLILRWTTSAYASRVLSLPSCLPRSSSRRRRLVS